MQVSTVPFESLRMSHVTKGAFIFVKWPCVTRLKGLVRQGLVSQTQKGAKFNEKWLKIEIFFSDIPVLPHFLPIFGCSMTRIFK